MKDMMYLGAFTHLDFISYRVDALDDWIGSIIVES
jgi:hypothetical protein